MKLTTYELHKKFEQAGFVWHPWPMSQKRRETIAPYLPGNDKVRFSNLPLPMHAYLIALFRAEGDHRRRISVASRELTAVGKVAFEHLQFIVSFCLYN